MYNGVTFEVTGTSWIFVTFGVCHFCRSHFYFGKVTRTEKKMKHVTTTPLVKMGSSNACLLMFHQQNEYRVLYQDRDGSWKEAPSSGNRLKEKSCFTDSVSQHIAEIEEESLEVYLLFCIDKVSSRKHTINVWVCLNRDWILAQMVTQPKIKQKK